MTTHEGRITAAPLPHQTTGIFTFKTITLSPHPEACHWSSSTQNRNVYSSQIKLSFSRRVEATVVGVWGEGGRNYGNKRARVEFPLLKDVGDEAPVVV